MRKLIVLGIMLFGAASILQAQKGTVGKNTVKAVTKNPGRGTAGSVGTKVRGTTGPLSGAGGGQAIRNLSTRANTMHVNGQPLQLGQLGNVGKAATFRSPLKSVPVPRVNLPDAPLPQQAAPKNLDRVEEIVAALEKKQELQSKAWDEFYQTGIGKSVLFAPVEAPGKTGGFSVTVVKVPYNGQEEVFGVIATHVLPESYYTFNSSLKRHFHVQIKQADDTQQLVEAEVVQISPRSMLDISLVKFSPQAETQVQPLELSSTPIQKQEKLYSYGYGAAQPMQEERTVQQLSLLSVRTDQNLTADRQGFCGSPLLDGNNQVKAIHTGTKSPKDLPEISYGTHAHFINLLVEAYHNQGNALYNFVIDGQTMAQFNVDEYISAVYLYDANGKRLLQKNIEDKFSESFLRKALAGNPQARYLQLTTRKAQWETDQDGDSILKEDRSRSDKTKHQHWYNLQTKQIEPKRPAIIKM